MSSQLMPTLLSLFASKLAGGAGSAIVEATPGKGKRTYAVGITTIVASVAVAFLTGDWGQAVMAVFTAATLMYHRAGTADAQQATDALTQQLQDSMAKLLYDRAIESNQLTAVPPKDYSDEEETHG